MGFFKSIFRPIAQVVTVIAAPAISVYAAAAKEVAPGAFQKATEVPVAGTVVKGVEAGAHLYVNAAQLAAEGKSPNLIRDYVDSAKGAAIVGAAMVGAGAVSGGGAASLGLAEGAAAAGGGIGGAVSTATLMDKFLEDPIKFAGNYIDKFIGDNTGIKTGFFADQKTLDPFGGGGGGGVRGMESPIIIGEPGEGMGGWIIIGGGAVLLLVLIRNRSKK